MNNNRILSEIVLYKRLQINNSNKRVCIVGKLLQEVCGHKNTHPSSWVQNVFCQVVSGYIRSTATFFVV